MDDNNNPRPDIPDVEWFKWGAASNRVLSTEELQQIMDYLNKEHEIVVIDDIREPE